MYTCHDRHGLETDMRYVSTEPAGCDHDAIGDSGVVTATVVVM